MSQIIVSETQLRKDIAKRLNRHRVSGHSPTMVKCSCNNEWRSHRAHTEHLAEDAIIPARAAVNRLQSVIDIERKHRKP